MLKKISITIILLFCITFSVFADDTPDYYIEDNILYINNMKDYNLLNLPEYLSNDITKVVISDGIDYIGDFAFYNMTGITEVVIPESCTEIGSYSFYKCSGLINIDINNITKINKYAFYGCSNLEFTTEADCGACALEFEGDAQNAFNKSLAKVNTMKDYLNEVYLGTYPELAFDIDYCSPDDIELLQALADKLTVGCTDNESKAAAIYEWVRTNISYGLTSESFSAIDVYKNREGVCSGYAQLTSTLFRLSGIPSAIVRCSKQGTSNIDLETSNYYQTRKGHQFVVAYVDNDWYGYDACWGKDQPGVWCKMPAERMADQYIVLHVDGIMTYSDEAWDYTTLGFKATNTWYVDGEFLCMQKGEVVLMGGFSQQVGGCLTYIGDYWYNGCENYYTYLGTGTNIANHAYLGGYYTDIYFGHDILLYQNNGIKETEYFTYNEETYFNGIKVNNLIQDIGLIDGDIRLYVGESIDFSELYSNCTITSNNTNIVTEGTTITANAEGRATVSINNGTKTYCLEFYVEDYTGDELTQELCDHDNTRVIESETICNYCGKHLEDETVIIDESEIIDESSEENIEEEAIVEDTHSEEILEETNSIDDSVDDESISEVIEEEVVEEPTSETHIEESNIAEETTITEPTNNNESTIEEPVEESESLDPVVDPIEENVDPVVQEELEEEITPVEETITVDTKEETEVSPNEPEQPKIEPEENVDTEPIEEVKPLKTQIKSFTTKVIIQTKTSINNIFTLINKSSLFSTSKKSIFKKSIFKF